MLLTNHPVETLDEACEKLQWYKRRWMIETYFRTLKSGFKVESTRLNKQI
ncbi:MAG: transposase [Oligoflexus sp.]